MQVRSCEEVPVREAALCLWAPAIHYFRRIATLAFVCLFVASAGSDAAAQNTATIRGTVSDTSGAGLPGASVTVTNAGTRDARTASSDTRGGFVFAGLFP